MTKSTGLKIPDHVFVADCHGLTSISPVDPTAFKSITLYCQANFHRLCVWGIIDIEDHVAEALQSMIDTGEGEGALNAIKSSKYALPQNLVMKYERNLERIPNPELDPI